MQDSDQACKFFKWLDKNNAHVAMQQHHLSMKGLPDIRPRPWLQEMKGMRLMQEKQKHGRAPKDSKAKG